ncbi:MAG: lytic murein transglycosylase [Corynebacterium sp.]|nr:lytic murein transglycosylase [Corynebacterium sp.]
MTSSLRRASGCGCIVVIAVVMVVGIVALTALGIVGSGGLGGGKSQRTLQPIPENVPPLAGAEVAEIDINAPGRTADRLSFWSQGLSENTGISGQALRAYGNAELIAKQSWPECHLRWNTLAGIGWVETRHGTYSGNWFQPAHLDENGFATPPIIGIALNGHNNTAVIADTDGGKWDGDVEFDRAMGPMQFIPDSWRRYGRDANGDGEISPQQIDDAALSAANLLCANGRDLSTEQGWVEAIYSYNFSSDYVSRVARAANSYALEQPATS